MRREQNKKGRELRLLFGRINFGGSCGDGDTACILMALGASSGILHDSCLILRSVWKHLWIWQFYGDFTLTDVARDGCVGVWMNGFFWLNSYEVNLSTGISTQPSQLCL